MADRCDADLQTHGWDGTGEAAAYGRVGCGCLSAVIHRLMSF